MKCEDVARAALGAPVKVVGDELFYHCPHPELHKTRDEHASLKINNKKDLFLEAICGAKGKAWALAAFLAGVEPTDKKAVTAWLREHSLLGGANHAKAKGGRKARSARGPVSPSTFTRTRAENRLLVSCASSLVMTVARRISSGSAGKLGNG